MLIRNDYDKARCISAIKNIKIGDKPWVMTLEEHDEKRRDCQNRLSFVLYRELGKLTGHGEAYERHRCKLHYGVPILRREDKEFNQFYNKSILRKLDYEDKLDAMEYFPVTRLMKIKQFAEYLTTIYDESSAQGYVLSRPEDLYFEALMKEAG